MEGNDSLASTVKEGEGRENKGAKKTVKHLAVQEGQSSSFVRREGQGLTLSVVGKRREK